MPMPEKSLWVHQRPLYVGLLTGRTVVVLRNAVNLPTTEVGECPATIRLQQERRVAVDCSRRHSAIVYEATRCSRAGELQPEIRVPYVLLGAVSHRAMEMGGRLRGDTRGHALPWTDVGPATR